VSGEDGKVELGFFSFTEVTDPAEHHSYNAWHQLDHMPEQFPLAGIAYGERWVATPACRTARRVASPDLAPIHYMTLYLMAAPVEQTLREFMALGRALRDLGRFHEHRRARLSGPLRVQSERAAARVLISAPAVPYRPARGVYVVVETGAPGDHDDAAHTDALLAVDGVAGVWTFAAAPTVEPYSWSARDTRIAVCWLDGDPLTVARAIDPIDAERERRAAEAGVTTLYAGPFETITPWQWGWFDAPAPRA
jgi:hypothetical protein